MVRSSKKYCSVLTCVNYYNLLEERCFSFPRNKKIAQDWILAINNPTLNFEYAHTYHKSLGVCHRHFATSQFTTPARIRLNRGVVPTQFLPSRDNCENGLPASEIQKAYLASARKGTICRFAQPVAQADCKTEEANAKEDTDTGMCEEAGSQLPNHLGSRRHSCTYKNVSIRHLPQKVQGSTEKPVQEDSWSVEDISTESSATGLARSGRNQSDRRNVRKEPVADIDDSTVDGREPSEMCDTGSYQGDTDEYEDLKLNPLESFMVATDTWEHLPNLVCRLCASTDEHPKQSIVGWLGMLNEIIPGLVAVNDGLPQHICRPCTNKLYTCCKIKTGFIGAYKKLEESFGFTKSTGIQFVHLPADGSSYQTFNEFSEDHLVYEVEEQLLPEDAEELVTEVEEQSVYQVVKPLMSDTEVQLLSQVEERLMTEADEQLVSEAKEHVVFMVPSDVSCGVLNTSNKDLLKGKEIVLNSVDKSSMNIQESVISCSDDGDEKDSASNISPECYGNVQRVESRKKKYKYVCGECEEMFTIKGALSRHKRTHFGTVFECDYCKKQCTSVTQLNDHRRIHTKELPFMCEICGKRFRTSMNLSNHKYVHKPPIYICEVCNKKCSSRFYLNQHKKVHSLDTKLICEVCGKMIYTPFSLKIHMRTHTGEKPFQCAACGRCFISAARLRKHRLVHTDRKFRCVTCGKEFYFRSSLIKHQESHNALREAYKCPICFTLFANSDNMRRHGKVYCKHPLCTICGQTLLTDEMVEENRATEYEKEEVVVAARNHIRQYFKSCPVCSQTICGRENMLKHMRECHKDHSYKPFACQRCLKTLHTSGVLQLHRT